MFVFFFFFQAEDGIRDLTVTGVQTCALPISWSQPRRFSGRLRARAISLGVASFFLILESTPAANLTDELRPSSSLDFQSTLWLDSAKRGSKHDLFARGSGRTAARGVSHESLGH